jgi:3-phenylpropionate/cinnamic acid dioxygenase small subunit
MGADAEIRTLLARIAQLADTGDLDEYLTCFTEVAVWQMPDNPAVGMTANAKRGHAEIRQGAEERRASGLQGPGTATRHVLTTTAITVESEARATARSYFMFFGTTAGTPTIRTMGQYDDVLVKGEHGWQLAHRIITVG